VRGQRSLIVLAAGLALSPVSCDGASTDEANYVETREPCADRDPLRRAFFGDLHVHTTFSFDAHVFDVRTTPDDAYRFARGEPVQLPPLDANGKGTRSLRLERPLDFVALTDHSEFLGEVEICTTPGSPQFDSKSCENYRNGERYDVVRGYGIRLALPSPQRDYNLCGEDYAACTGPNAAGRVWNRVKESAQGAYDRSARCSFTSFIAYEYTAATGASTLHRNVIFKNDHVPFPTTYFEQPTPRGLWQELDTTCRRAGNGCDVIAIPHNPNESNGRMFRVEYPGAEGLAGEKAQAELRSSLEPLVEIYQHKGDSECRNGMSAMPGGPDEQCEFEKHTRTPNEDCGDGIGSLGSSNKGCYSRLDFVRGALLAGLGEEDRLGVNPYRLGIVASTDTHNGTPGAVEESAFIGHRGIDDDTPAKQLGTGELADGGISYGAGGITGIWAEENSRPSLFEAMKRREVFGTSGPRIAVRFFGGWGLSREMCSDPQMIAKGYESGVPMGGLLAPRPPGAGAPVFVVSALRDAGTAARPGSLLQRVQIVKGWIEGGVAHQEVFDIAGGANDAAVDTSSCVQSGPGASELCATWVDPTFAEGQRAFYYARVLENPSCRWSTFVCNGLADGAKPASCNDLAAPKTIQERAWTSPIWLQP
jgi:hypothetical protein